MLISRMRRSLERSGFAERVFAPTERAYLETRADAAQSAAGLFAAKEAFLKATGRGIGSMPLAAIVIEHTKDGAPYLGTPFDRGSVLISITHMGDVAAAVAVWDA